MADIDDSSLAWISQRLPGGACFSKNGESLNTAEAIQSAWDDHVDQEDDSKRRKLVLADLFDILASEIVSDSVQIGPFKISGSQFEKKANYWREQAEDTTVAGSFSSVPIVGQTVCCDEYSR